MHVQSLDGFLQFLDCMVEGLSINWSPAKDGSANYEDMGPDGASSKINPLVNLSLLSEAVTSEAGVRVQSGKVPGNSCTLKDSALTSLEGWELACEYFLFVLL